MERKSGKEIKLLFTMALLSAAILLVYAHSEELQREAQLGSLLLSHPQLEADLVQIYGEAPSAHPENRKAQLEAVKRLKEKYGYEGTLPGNAPHPAIWLAALGGAVLFGLIFIASERRRERARKEELCGRLDELLSRIVSMQKGGEQRQPALCRAEALEEKWNSVQDACRVLQAQLAIERGEYAKEESRTRMLITDISHQVKTPLASLRMSHELAVSGRLAAEEQEEFLAQEAAEIDRLEQLFLELEKLSRLENHMIAVTPEAQPLGDLLKDAAGQIYAKAKARGIELSVGMEDGLYAVYDRKWTAEALSNLLDNAVKYSGTGQTVRLRASALVRHVMIEVEDDGIGVRPEEVHRIFQRFYRGIEAAETENSGAGIGLYLARKILGEENGTIMVKRKAKGCIFRMVLPLADPADVWILEK